jgi:centractin
MAGEVERAPEVLFRPELIGSEEKGKLSIMYKYNVMMNRTIGVHDCLVSAVMRSDMDVRRTLFGQVVLSGGTTLLKG